MKSFSPVLMLGTKRVKGGTFFFKRESDFKEVQSGEGGGRGAGGGAGEGLRGGGSVCSFQALKRRDGEKEKKSSSHCAGVDMRATGCDRLGDRSLSHTRRHLQKQPITQIKCQADKRESTGRVKTCGFIYGHKTDFLTLSAGGKKSSTSSLFAKGDYLAG